MQKIVFHEHTPRGEAVAYIRLRRERFLQSVFWLMLSLLRHVTEEMNCDSLMNTQRQKLLMKAKVLSSQGFLFVPEIKLLVNIDKFFRNPSGFKRYFQIMSWVLESILNVCPRS